MLSVLLIPSAALGQSDGRGACSFHGGVDCSQLDLEDLSVVCSDGWKESTVSYLNVCTETIHEVFDTIALSRCRDYIPADIAILNQCIQNEYFALAIKSDPTCVKGMEVSDNGTCWCRTGQIWDGYICRNPLGNEVQEKVNSEYSQFCLKPIDLQIQSPVVTVGVFNTRSYDYLYDHIKANCSVDPRSAMINYQVRWPQVTHSWIDTQISAQTTSDPGLVSKLKGRILLQVQQHGEAWYLNPTTLKRYYMKDGPTAYEMLRSFGLGITESDYTKIASGDLSIKNRLRGRIVLRVQAKGEAYYIHPSDLSVTYLKDGDAAYQIMRELSLGILDADLYRIPIERFVPLTK